MADDKTFIKRFSSIILGLVVFTIAIIVLAVSFQNPSDPADNPSQLTLAEERIAPVAAVNTGDYEQPGIAEPAAVPVAVDAGEDTIIVAESGSIDGAAIYNTTCAACHNAGVAGAPVPGGTMNERVGKGLDTLVANAINGIGIMPPRGGNASLSDEEIRAAVEFMMQ